MSHSQQAEQNPRPFVIPHTLYFLCMLSKAFWRTSLRWENQAETLQLHMAAEAGPMCGQVSCPSYDSDTGCLFSHWGKA